MSENQPSFFYGVAYGYNRGVFSTYKEAMAAMKGFPQAVYKKFKNRDDAEEFVQKSKPDATLFEAKETDTDDKFYAVARGRVIGIFKDLETVKKNTQGFPKSMHKKFATFAEAKSYFDKFSEGKVDETAKSPRRKRTHAETTEGNTDGPTVRNVARKRTSGKVGDTDESEGGELDHTQIMNESTEDEEGGGADQEEEEKETEEAVSNKNIDNKDKIENGGEVEEKKVEEEGDKSEVIMDEGKGQKDEENPSNAVEEQQKHAIMEE